MLEEQRYLGPDLGFLATYEKEGVEYSAPQLGIAESLLLVVQEPD